MQKEKKRRGDFTEYWYTPIFQTQDVAMSRRRHILASKFFDTGVSVRRTYRFGFWTLQLMFVTKKILI
jgi:hypothetical protein